VGRKEGKRRESRKRTNDLANLPRAQYDWIYERIIARTETVNAEYWQFHITDIEEVQIPRHRPLQFFAWHFDTFPGSPRKLTCVVNLSPPQSYWRGGLEVTGRHDGEAIAPLQGPARGFQPICDIGPLPRGGASGGRSSPGWPDRPGSNEPDSLLD
jgi:hypothetical protein